MPPTSPFKGGPAPCAAGSVFSIWPFWVHLQGTVMSKITPFPEWAGLSDNQGRDIKTISAGNDSDINYQVGPSFTG